MLRAHQGRICYARCRGAQGATAAGARGGHHRAAPAEKERYYEGARRRSSPARAGEAAPHAGRTLDALASARAWSRAAGDRRRFPPPAGRRSTRLLATDDPRRALPRTGRAAHIPRRSGKAVACLASGSNGARPRRVEAATWSSTGLGAARAPTATPAPSQPDARRSPGSAGSRANSPPCAPRESVGSTMLRRRRWRRLPSAGAPPASTSSRAPRSATASSSAASCHCSAHAAELVTALHAAGRKRETIRKSVSVLAQVLDFADVKDNPARNRVQVRLPREEREEPSPPAANQIEAVLPMMPRRYALALLVLDATGMRVGELEEKGLRCGDLDEPNSRWRIRRAVEKGRRGRWVSLPPELFAAVLAALPPREDRERDRPVFPGLTQERLRTAIARACKASGTPTWSPHDLRHRRISLWHRQGETWALIGARVGQRSLSVTADTYTHVLLDDRELDHTRLATELEVARL